MNFICLTLFSDRSILVNMDHVISIHDTDEFRRIQTRGPAPVVEVTETLEQIGGFIAELNTFHQEGEA